MERRIDVLLWGVTAWTGIHLLEHFARSYPLNVEDPLVSWAIVSRSKEKMDKAIKQVAASLDVPWLYQVERFIIDNNDLLKIQEVLPLAKVVATVVGPYAKYGENLLRACAESGTHYCDITGETLWVQMMIRKYHTVAKENGSIIIPFCGSDCVPSDINAFCAVKALDAAACEKFELAHENLDRKFVIQGLMSILDSNNRHKNGPAGGGGTVSSLVAFLEDRKTWASFNKYNVLSEEDTVNTVDANSNSHVGVGRNSKLGKWTTHHVMAPIDAAVVRRSRYLLAETYGDSVSYKEGFVVNNGMTAVALSAFFSVCYAALQVAPVRKQILKLSPSPSTFPNPLPAPEKYKPGNFEFVTLAQGTYKIGKESKKLECKVTFKAPDEVVWTYTSIFLAESAIVLAKSSAQVRENSSLNGGILTTACMGELLIKRLQLQRVEIKVEVEETP